MNQGRQVHEHEFFFFSLSSDILSYYGLRTYMIQMCKSRHPKLSRAEVYNTLKLSLSFIKSYTWNISSINYLSESVIYGFWLSFLLKTKRKGFWIPEGIRVWYTKLNSTAEFDNYDEFWMSTTNYKI